ncbi:MAG: sulfatase-like hydrolase/transferase [Betaproteobacteria bacterium]
MARSLRSTIILGLVAIGTVLAAVGGWRYARASAPVNGPIVLISIDTLRADHLPVYGYTKVRTPAIDALARDGVVFDHAYSHAPQTLPAHTALLSGRLPFDTGVRDNLGFTVPPKVRLLPQMLHDRGYATGGVVSAFVLRHETGISRGFDFFDDKMPPSSPEVTIGEIQRDGGESEAIAERWLTRIGTSRAFLFLHLYEPHKPYTPPARYAQYAPYDGEIAYADEIVGRLMKYLKTHQLYDQSTIVLLADHGEGLGDHGEQEHGLFVYDETIHVPLIVKMPGGEHGGRRIPDVVSQVDIVPTILDLVKAPIPDNLRGRSLTPLLDGTGQLPEQAVYSEAMYGRYHFGWSELTALTDGRYRYIKAPHDELYDLERDPHERDNLAGDRPQARMALRSALDRLTNGTKIDAPAEVSADARERLAALGYVGSQAAPPDTPGDELPDPKDKLDILERYRAAVDLAQARQWPQAIALLQQILKDDPGMADVWTQLATIDIRAARFEQAIDAYKHAIELQPAVANTYIGAASAMLHLRKFEDARKHAELAAQVASDANDAHMVASAHEMLANIALARHDEDAARQEAALAQKAEPSLPIAAYVDARLLYDAGRYEDALPLFEQAIAALKAPGSIQMPELHYYAGDTLGRLERYPEAEAEFEQELRFFPQNFRARAGLAMLYQATGRPDAAGRAITDMVRITPTPESYALGVRLWTMFGNPDQANALRTEARRTFAEAPRPGARPGRQR